ncbi:phosphate ABC transporter substrate-binding/OmpA family protein [Halopseudomonas yangmingensis]|uniref:NitT/TauT family transport system substrate-binding protein n=1 Tax=Halopseudomonas yangmingensis TaxID=1720063 RepID=A0A1I4N9Y7_9GAMM|nr:phosphate ABC transporter substrate-binding/OmpA family protein [Halopseudomonas yangmingensis]SFM12309.1 NitT/TauT family transport system substrate-binding protein [Halopseudomonas yangmingensis]
MSKSRLWQRGSAAGTLITVVLVGLLIGLGIWLIGRDAGPGVGGAALFADADAPEPVEPLRSLPSLASAAPYVPRDSIIDVDISEYAGYAGLIVANGGLQPNPDSLFAREYGFQVRLTLNEEEGWSKVNNGQVAASVTTADVLAVLGRQFDVKVPAQIAFSRGANQVVVDRGIASVNQLKGKVLAASQFNESDFFIRYLASEAGVPVKVLRDLDARPAAGELGLVFYEDAVVACDAYASVLASGSGRLNGCVGWSPRTDQVVTESAGQAKMLVSNRNLLIVSDLLLVNRGFADAQPQMVEGLVYGLLEGNRRLREAPAEQAALVASAFGWSEAETLDELSKVHFSNLPENRAFFEGTIDAAGSFQGIFQSSVLVYGDLIRNPADPSRFVDMRALEALEQTGRFAGQTVAIAPIRTSDRVMLEGDALLSKDIRFFFEPNSALLDKQARENQEYLDTIRRFLQVSPGSIVLLRGHVDNQRLAEFERQGGPTLVRSMALKAMELSRQRAQAVADALLERHPGIDRERIELVGRGWEEPVSPDSELNRRVEVQWFTLE